MLTRVTVILMLGAVALAACAAEAAKEVPLEGTRWTLVSYQTPGRRMGNTLEGTQVWAVFENGQVSGSSGCNNFNGGYTVSGDSISIGPLAATLMACPAPIMAQEQLFLAALQSAATYAVNDDQLVLTDADGRVAVLFTAQEPIGLSSVGWDATGINNGKGGVVSLVAGTEVTAVFGDDGTLSGSSGCNTYTGGYELDGELISIGPLATTRKACPPETMEQEDQYLAALGTVATWSIGGDRLELRTETGALAAGYTAGEPVE